MPTSKHEDGATPKPTRRRTSTAIPEAAQPATQPANEATRTEATHAAPRNVTEAKPPASVSARASAPPTLPVTETPRNAEEEIRRRAYELYEQDGRQHGRDRDHWFRAEAEVLGNENQSTERVSRRNQKSA